MDSTFAVFKNTILLFIRMLQIMAVSLYTIRIALQFIGIVDYGIFIVVVGFVAMLGFLSQILNASTQRFFTLPSQKKNLNKINNDHFDDGSVINKYLQIIKTINNQ